MVRSNGLVTLKETVLFKHLRCHFNRDLISGHIKYLFDTISDHNELAVLLFINTNRKTLRLVITSMHYYFWLYDFTN